MGFLQVVRCPGAGCRPGSPRGGGSGGGQLPVGGGAARPVPRSAAAPGRSPNAAAVAPGAAAAPAVNGHQPAGPTAAPRAVSRGGAVT